MGEDYRSQLARDVLLAMMTSPLWNEVLTQVGEGRPDTKAPNNYARIAVVFTDALIAELNRKEPAE